MKTYCAVIEIVKEYKDGYCLDTVLWQKTCKTKSEASSFIQRVGSGKPGLYSVNSAIIEVE